MGKVVGRFKVIKTAEFDYGHRIPDHNSKCRNVHGHRGRVEVEVTGPLQTSGSANGMVMDFSVIKDVITRYVVEPFDHSFLMYNGDPLVTALRIPGLDGNNQFLRQTGYGPVYDVKYFGRVQLLDRVPTAENLAEMIFVCLSQAFAPYPGVRVTCVKFWETPSSCAIYESGWCEA